MMPFAPGLADAGRANAATVKAQLRLARIGTPVALT
jgi:hypothetical protein